jgi:hypothetical protein
MAELRERQEEHERKLWEAKLEAELRMTQEKIEIEKSARGTTAKLPKLKILTQVHEKIDHRREEIRILVGDGMSKG